ncbi:heavy-metal-associated domain-containing protein [Algibacter miyuki]|uniref:Heavy-metal-associated domain-containing protein n=1 Tax=Algibacter miyuki TaxID=1306933 RepID=A0ABV5H4Z4_9FLAO|nr:heavy-metal-associated domain-containing protein [Algibacter miyuki]MDN3663801.1 heavy-metal-associated domain-containing protein [Algibacter miyuki]
MKKIILSIITMATLGFTSCKNEAKTNENSNDIAINATFGVRGNCGMCKTTIEKAAKSVEGVTYANWDVDKKTIELAFDDTKTTTETIHKAIAASGYDTESAVGVESAYDNLPGCCQYDHAMEMNQSGEEDHSGHSN